LRRSSGGNSRFPGLARLYQVMVDRFGWTCYLPKPVMVKMNLSIVIVFTALDERWGEILSLIHGR
jgi:hypothetical protein